MTSRQCEQMGHYYVRASTTRIAYLCGTQGDLTINFAFFTPTYVTDSMWAFYGFVLVLLYQLSL